MKTRAEMKQIQQEYFGDASLPEICLSARQSMNGASEPAGRLQLTFILAFLCDIISTWKPPLNKRDRGMDMAVWELVKATITYMQCTEWPSWDGAPMTPIQS